LRRELPGLPQSAPMGQLEDCRVTPGKQALQLLYRRATPGKRAPQRQYRRVTPGKRAS